VTHLRWDEIERERLNPSFVRQVVHAERITIARLELDRGYVVPRHRHENEQITLVQMGRLHFRFDDHEQVVGPGEIMVIPPNAAHEVEVLEDCAATDLFSPIREDWIRGEDAYLREGTA
jgi:unsaturated pyranuronate lyase